MPKNSKSTVQEISKLIKSKFTRQSGIIYCMTKKECDSVALGLRKESIKAMSYHAGLTDNKRNDVQLKWTSNTIHVNTSLFLFNSIRFKQFAISIV